MATILKGIDGKAVMEGSTIGITAWTFSAAQELPDVTEIGDNFREYFPTIKSASGSVTFNLKSNEDQQNALLIRFSNSTAQSSTAIAMELHCSTNGDKLAFNAFLSGFDLPGAVENVFPVNCNYNMTGALTAVPSSTST